MHTSIIIPKQFLYTLYLCPCLGLGLFMSYPLCGLFFIFIFILLRLTYNLINRGACSFAYFLEYVLLFLDGNVEKRRCRM